LALKVNATADPFGMTRMATATRTAQQQIPFGGDDKKGKSLSGLEEGAGREADFSAPRCALQSK
jgi:hypothetical protein